MIDTSKWKEFRVGDLFDIHPTKAYKANNAQLLNDGDYPVVVNSAYNNGIGGYSSFEPTETGNMITFSDTVDANTIFYQGKPFVGYAHVQGLYPIGEYADKWNKESLMFFAPVFRRAALTKGFDYGNKFRRDIAVDLMVKLPAKLADDKYEPDWDYMESYMKKVMEETEEYIRVVGGHSFENHPIDVSKWCEFRICDLFDTSLPKGDLQIKKVEDGNIPLITPSNYNNGMFQRIAADSPSTLYKKGSLTVDMFGNAYYQEEDFFVTAHGHVNVLLPKIDLNLYTGIFVSSAIRAMFLDKYGFNEMCTQKVLKIETIKLPITPTGEPDWKYMENYMKNILDEAEKAINTLTN